MKYEIIGGSFPAVNVKLDTGESVITQSGAMAWEEPTIEMQTNAEGGLLKSIGRMFSGASLMFVTHTATQDDSDITFSASFPGTSLQRLFNDGTTRLQRACLSTFDDAKIQRLFDFWHFLANFKSLFAIFVKNRGYFQQNKCCEYQSCNVTTF